MATNLKYVFDDGGRKAAGFGPCRGRGDCVARAVSIASGLPYAEVHARLTEGVSTQRESKKYWQVMSLRKAMGRKVRTRDANDGIRVQRKWFKDYMQELGFHWVPTMQVGQGCKVHLLAGELPMQGKLIVSVSRHMTAVIDGVIHDTFNPSRATVYYNSDGESYAPSIRHRCVYGYWTKTSKEEN
jgi:hypothetical protein